MAASNRGFSDLLPRIASGAIYTIVVFASLACSPISAAICCSGMAALCSFEYLRLCKAEGRMPNDIIGISSSVLFPLAPLVGDKSLLLIVCLALLLACTFWYVLTPRATISDVMLTFFSGMYTGLSFACLVLLRSLDAGLDGAILALGVVLSVWLNDVAAYFVGSRFGQHKLMPRISPKKSVEGFVAGLIVCFCVWVGIVIIAPCGLPPVLGLIAGPLVGASAVLGDLFESRIKRGVGVKDSGVIMPGHGGMLDRSDALILASATAYLILHLGGML